MFKTENEESVMQIGKKNIEVIKKALQKEKIEVVSSELAEDYGRTMYFHLDDGRIRISAFNRQTITI